MSTRIMWDNGSIYCISENEKTLYKSWIYTGMVVRNSNLQHSTMFERARYPFHVQYTRQGALERRRFTAQLRDGNSLKIKPFPTLHYMRRAAHTETELNCSVLCAMVCARFLGSFPLPQPKSCVCSAQRTQNVNRCLQIQFKLRYRVCSMCLDMYFVSGWLFEKQQSPHNLQTMCTMSSIYQLGARVHLFARNLSLRSSQECKTENARMFPYQACFCVCVYMLYACRS